MEGIYWCFDSKRYMSKDKSHTVGGGGPRGQREGGTNGGRAGRLRSAATGETVSLPYCQVSSPKREEAASFA